ncbi:uncharacterized protein ASCRUDRAFT_71478 [Ascoidea rubescens DSM 1968]|uniref:Uncharacterized protein n=1 Tax=Ascoidea rubescens DSM 1968 TaxID=1344418 RepID=A0A1D2VD59_9ASCO|nr:hypothetical protein ASCRUDRAFT_71478 [Ascoidea rubescens DSM 1968]ODV59512.1 hypothetical protein ASCRUDRAFT_71478 [Ascoidea rubescens DSM 1968]
MWNFNKNSHDEEFYYFNDDLKAVNHKASVNSKCQYSAKNQFPNKNIKTNNQNVHFETHTDSVFTPTDPSDFQIDQPLNHEQHALSSSPTSLSSPVKIKSILKKKSSNNTTPNPIHFKNPILFNNAQISKNLNHNKPKYLLDSNLIKFMLDQDDFEFNVARIFQFFEDTYINNGASTSNNLNYHSFTSASSTNGKVTGYNFLNSFTDNVRYSTLKKGVVYSCLNNIFETYNTQGIFLNLNNINSSAENSIPSANKLDSFRNSSPFSEKNNFSEPIGIFDEFLNSKLYTFTCNNPPDPSSLNSGNLNQQDLAANNTNSKSEIIQITNKTVLQLFLIKENFSKLLDIWLASYYSYLKDYNFKLYTSNSKNFISSDDIDNVESYYYSYQDDEDYINYLNSDSKNNQSPINLKNKKNDNENVKRKTKNSYNESRAYGNSIYNKILQNVEKKPLLNKFPPQELSIDDLLSISRAEKISRILTSSYTPISVLNLILFSPELISKVWSITFYPFNYKFKPLLNTFIRFNEKLLNQYKYFRSIYINILINPNNDFIYNLTDIFIKRNININQMLEFFLKLILTDKWNSSTGIINKLNDEGFISSILNLLSSKYPSSIQNNAADLLRDIIKNSTYSTHDPNADEYDYLLFPETHLTNPNTLGGHSLLRDLCSYKQIKKLFEKIKNETGVPLALSIDILIDIIRNNNTDYDYINLLIKENFDIVYDNDFDLLEVYPVTERDPIYLNNILTIGTEYLDYFYKFLVSANGDNLTDESYFENDFDYNLFIKAFNLETYNNVMNISEEKRKAGEKELLLKKQNMEDYPLEQERKIQNQRSCANFKYFLESFIKRQKSEQVPLSSSDIPDKNDNSSTFDQEQIDEANDKNYKINKDFYKLEIPIPFYPEDHIDSDNDVLKTLAESLPKNPNFIQTSMGIVPRLNRDKFKIIELTAELLHLSGLKLYNSINCEDLIEERMTLQRERENNIFEAMNDDLLSDNEENDNINDMEVIYYFNENLDKLDIANNDFDIKENEYDDTDDLDNSDIDELVNEEQNFPESVLHESLTVSNNEKKLNQDLKKEKIGKLTVQIDDIKNSMKGLKIDTSSPPKTPPNQEVYSDLSQEQFYSENGIIDMDLVNDIIENEKNINSSNKSFSPNPLSPQSSDFITDVGNLATIEFSKGGFNGEGNLQLSTNSINNSEKEVKKEVHAVEYDGGEYDLYENYGSQYNENCDIERDISENEIHINEENDNENGVQYNDYIDRTTAFKDYNTLYEGFDLNEVEIRELGSFSCLNDYKIFLNKFENRKNDKNIVLNKYQERELEKYIFLIQYILQNKTYFVCQIENQEYDILKEMKSRNYLSLGDKYKLKLKETNFLKLLFRKFLLKYPWHILLDNVLYDFFQQIMNLPSFNLNLNILLIDDLFVNVKINNILLYIYEKNDEFYKKTQLEFGMMGHVFLISEEVFKFIMVNNLNLINYKIVDQFTKKFFQFSFMNMNIRNNYGFSNTIM